MLWDPFLYCINDSIQGNSEAGNKVFVLPSKVAINMYDKYGNEYYCIDENLRSSLEAKLIKTILGFKLVRKK